MVHPHSDAWRERWLWHRSITSSIPHNTKLSVSLNQHRSTEISLYAHAPNYMKLPVCFLFVCLYERVRLKIAIRSTPQALMSTFHFSTLIHHGCQSLCYASLRVYQFIKQLPPSIGLAASTLCHQQNTQRPRHETNFFQLKAECFQYRRKVVQRLGLPWPNGVDVSSLIQKDRNENSVWPRAPWHSEN